MRVAMYYNNSKVLLEEQELPEIGDGELLVKVMACGICGSDVMEWYRIKKAPLVLGHETTGVVEKSKNPAFKEGERIVFTHHVPCYECDYCKSGNETVCKTLRNTKFYPGGFSEYLRLPEINVKHGTFKLPDEVSFEEGTFVEPLGCVIRGQRIAGMKKGMNVLVLGSGISGLLHIQLARYLRAEKIVATDITDYKLEAAKKFGADFTINAKDEVSSKVEEYLGKKADLVTVCAGATPAVKQALRSVDKGGTVLLFAPTHPGEEIPIDLNNLWGKCVTLTTSYAADRKDLEEALSLIKEKKINVNDMITHKLPLEEIQEGFHLTSEAGESIKVIIEPNN